MKNTIYFHRGLLSYCYTFYHDQKKYGSFDRIPDCLFATVQKHPTAWVRVCLGNMHSLKIICLRDRANLFGILMHEYTSNRFLYKNSLIHLGNIQVSKIAVIKSNRVVLLVFD